MKLFFITLLFLSLPLKVQAGFPEGKDGFDIKKLKIILDCHAKRSAMINVSLDP